MQEPKVRFKVYRPQAMMNTIKRLNGQNLESQGLNNLTEAFQNFMTRTRFFATGSLRRTWSHSAIEFMKYRRLLPMLVADEHDLGSAFDSFDMNEGRCVSSRTSKEDRRVTVTNISPKATVHSCHMPVEERRQSMYATMGRHNRRVTTIHITFKDEMSALRAKAAAPQELKFYNHVMTVSAYTPKRRTTSHTEPGTSFSLGGGSDEGKLSRSSSVTSMGSVATVASQALPLDELPPRALECILAQAGALDRVRLERTAKAWLEASARAWARADALSFRAEPQLAAFFTHQYPLRNAHLDALLRRAGPHLRRLDLADARHVLDARALELVAAHCPLLEGLDASGVPASPDALRALSEQLPRLRAVAYRHMHSSGEKCFWYLFKSNGGSIRDLDLRGCSALKGRCFKLFGAALDKVLLDGCAQIDDAVLDELCARSKQVRTLSLSGCYKLTDQGLSAISRNLARLEHFALCGDGFRHVSSDGLMLVTRMSTITHLELDFNLNATSEVIERICDSLPRLTNLSLAFCGTDQSVDSNALLKIAKLKDLEELDLSGLSALNNDVFRQICESCPRLARFTVRSCIYLGDDGLRALANLEKLEEADLSGCILITTASVQDLIKHFSTEKHPNAADITLTVGGTLVEPAKLRYRNSRVHVDPEDLSDLSLEAVTKFLGSFEASSHLDSGDDLSDDGFGMLSAHRSFAADALTATEDSPLENDSSLLEWAEKEAKELGLLD